MDRLDPNCRDLGPCTRDQAYIIGQQNRRRSAPRRATRQRCFPPRRGRQTRIGGCGFYGLSRSARCSAGDLGADSRPIGRGGNHRPGKNSRQGAHSLSGCGMVGRGRSPQPPGADRKNKNLRPSAEDAALAPLLLCVGEETLAAEPADAPCRPDPHNRHYPGRAGLGRLLLNGSRGPIGGPQGCGAFTKGLNVASAGCAGAAMRLGRLARPVTPPEDSRLTSTRAKEMAHLLAAAI